MFFGDIVDVKVVTEDDETGDIVPYFASENFLEEGETVVDYSFKNGVTFKVEGEVDEQKYTRAVLVDGNNIKNINIYYDEELRDEAKKSWRENNS